MHLSNGKAVPLQAWTGPEGSRKVRLPQISWQRHRMVVGCQPYVPAAFYPQEILPVLIFRVDPQGRMKNSDGTIWNRNSDLPICSTAP
jgi:hypothetical protein